MAGESDIARLLEGLTASVRPGRYAVVTTERGLEMTQGVEALINERVGVTAVVRVDVAYQKGWDITAEFAWLTLDVHSSLLSVGLIAAVSRQLSDHNIPCNVLAGFYHDHILVPYDKAAEAKVLIDELGRRHIAPRT